MRGSAARRARAKGFRVVGSADDVAAQQAAIARESTNIAAAVDTCKAQIAPSSLAMWYQLAHDCLVFTSASSADQEQGKTLLSELAAWRNTLAAMGCAVPDLKFIPAPPPKQGGLLEALEARLSEGLSTTGGALLLLGGLYLLAKKL